jgi:hypothetical protein
MTDARSAFAGIYEADLWRAGSGIGSLPESTVAYRALAFWLIR